MRNLGRRAAASAILAAPFAARAQDIRVANPPGVVSTRVWRPAPRTTMLTQTWMGAATTYAASKSYTTETFLLVVPLESIDPHAFRVGFCNPYNIAMTVSSAYVWTTDSYPANCANLLTANNLTIAPSNGAGTQITFNNAGADVRLVNPSGGVTSATIPANAANGSNAAAGWPAYWSDFVSINPVARADGGRKPLVMICVTVTSTGYSAGIAGITTGSGNPQNGSGWVSMNSGALNRGRQWYTAHANGDYSSAPQTANVWNFVASHPVAFVQTLGMTPGIQSVQLGDSITVTGGNNTGVTTPLWLASCDLGDQTGIPMAVASFSWGGQASAVYRPFFQYNVGCIEPSVFWGQAISRNDGSTYAALNALGAMNLQIADYLRATFGTKFALQFPGCCPWIDNNSQQIADYTAFRNQLLAAGAVGSDGTIPYVDGPGLIGGAGGNWWDYLPNESADGTHPNTDLAASTLSPAVMAALRSLVLP
jgi:hypothetical protein